MNLMCSKYTVQKLHETKEDNFIQSCTYYVCIFIICVLLFIIVLPYIHEPNIKIISVGDENIHMQEAELSKVISCYYNTPSEEADHQLLPDGINPLLCTHINVAFAKIINKQIYLTDFQIKTINEVLQLKKTNSKLKVLVSVGGSGNNDGFSDMVVNHAARKTFIRSVKYLLRNHSLDGIDLDWEFPAVHLQEAEQGKRERQHFSQLLREIRMEFIRERRNYLLTVALAAQQIIVDVSYDIDQINMYVDFANVMTYDFHYYTKFTPFTGLNSPLFARNSEHLYLATLNVNYTVQMFLTKGLNESKIVIGIPSYGHSFTLVNKDNAGIGSPALGYGNVGSIGFVNYPDICCFIKNNSDVIIVEEKNTKVPYLHKGTEWISYETPESVATKAEYIRQLKLRGAMIYSLNADDYRGRCGESLYNATNFPLVSSIKNILDT
ncbi:unnamed protein product [Leptosia nina]|uniref:GH18 domain-containing protein n=1 Tax=Leptosia nina TaxID=320188 RepID=A0AAV1JM59_9NEOP